MKKILYQNFFLITLVTIFFSFSNLAYTQDLAAERKNAATYQAEIEQLEKDAKQYKSSISNAKASMIQIEAKVVPFGKAMQGDLSVLRKARVDAAENPSTETKSKVDNAKFKFILSERKFKRANRELENSRKEIQKLKGELKENQVAIAKKKTALEHQTLRINDLNKKQITNAAKAATVSKQKKEAAQREIKRLKDLLASEQAKARTKAKAKAKADTAKKTAIQTAKPKVSPRPLKSKTAPAVNAQNKPSTGPAESTANTKKSNSTSNKVANSAQALAQTMAKAQKENKEIQKRLGDLDLRQVRQRITKVLHIKTQHENRPLKQTSHSLNFIGKKLYQTTIKIRAGVNTYSVGNFHWQRDIPDTEDKAVYLITLDKMNPDKPKLIMFNKAYIQ